MNEGEAKNDTAQAVVQQDQGSIYWSKPKCSGTIPVGRSGHTLTVLGDKAYMFGGCDEEALAKGYHLVHCCIMSFPLRNPYTQARHANTVAAGHSEKCDGSE